MDKADYEDKPEHGVLKPSIKRELDRKMEEEYWPCISFKKLGGSVSNLFWSMQLIRKRARTLLFINY